MGYAVGLIPSGFYLVLGEKDLNGFIHQLVKSLGIILAIVIVKSIKNYVSQVLNLTWRQLLTRAVHRLYYTGINYYELNVFDKFIDNPYLKLSQFIPQILVLTFFFIQGPTDHCRHQHFVSRLQQNRNQISYFTIHHLLLHLQGLHRVFDFISSLKIQV